MPEQFGVFLPSKEDTIVKKQDFKEQQAAPLTAAEKSELSRLEKSSRQREVDINIFAPALDNIETLLLPEDKKNRLWQEVVPEDIEREKNNIIANIKNALARELDIIENEIMGLSQKQALIKKLELLTAEIENKTFNNFLSADDSLFLRQVLSARFTGLFAEQKRQDELGIRAFVNYKEQHQVN